MKFFFLKLELFFYEIISPHDLKSTKKIDFAIVTNQLWQISFFHPIWNDFYDGLNLRLRVNSAKYIAL